MAKVDQISAPESDLSAEHEVRQAHVKQYSMCGGFGNITSQHGIVSIALSMICLQWLLQSDSLSVFYFEFIASLQLDGLPVQISL